MSDAPQGNPGDITNWPILKIDYRTDADKVAALLPPGIEPGAEPNVHLSIYNVAVPDVPEYGIFMTVDADYRDVQGVYTLGYGIDQESAIFISRDMNGQPKYPCEIEYYRIGNKDDARLTEDDMQGISYLYPRNEFSVGAFGCASVSYRVHAPPWGILLLLLPFLTGVLVLRRRYIT